MAALREEIDKIAARLPEPYRLRLEDTLTFKGVEVDGLTDPTEALVWVALRSGDPLRVARHEEIHALKSLNLFTDQEWKTLEAAVERFGLMKEYKIEERYGELYRARYKDDESGAADRALMEEAIAHMLADYGMGRKFKGANRLLGTLHRLIQAIKEMLTGRKLLSVDDVFAKVESGEIGRRGSEKLFSRSDFDPSQQPSRPISANTSILEREIAKLARMIKGGSPKGWKDKLAEITAQLEQAKAGSLPPLSLVKTRSDRAFLSDEGTTASIVRSLTGTRTDYNIMAGNVRWGTVGVTTMPFSSKAYIEYVELSPGLATRSPRVWRELRARFHDEMPKIEEFFGTRISGARGTDESTQSVKWPIRAARDAIRDVEMPGGGSVHGLPLFALKAYHGTPHDFAPEDGAPAGRFRLDRIGTGEGAQAYGHGLYFAESEGVAQHYRDALQLQPDYSDTVRWKGASDPTPAQEAIMALLQTTDPATGLPMTLDGVRRQLIRMRRDANASAEAFGNPAMKQVAADATERIEALDKIEPLIEIRPPPVPTGRLYEVRLDVEAEELLDWDLPLSQQSPQIQEALRAKIPQWDTFSGKTGGDYVQYALGNTHAQDLVDSGIPGIRYLDQQSRVPAVQILSPADTVHGQWLVKQMPNGQVYYRGPDEAAARAAFESAPKPTYNYVIFDDSKIEIVARDGEPITPPEPPPTLEAGMRASDEAGDLHGMVEVCKI